LTIDLQPTKDLVANYSAKHQKACMVAFALAEDSDERLIEISRQKLWDKGVNAVIGNSFESLASSQTEVHFVTDSSSVCLTGSKSEVSVKIMELVAPLVK
jgi:hypothetical protein